MESGICGIFVALAMCPAGVTANIRLGVAMKMMFWSQIWLYAITDTYLGDKTLDWTLCTRECGVFLAVSMRTLRLATIAYLSYSIPNEPKLQQVINVKPNAEVKGSCIRSRSCTRMAQISKA